MSALPPLPAAEVTINLGPVPGDCRVSCPRRLSLREHMRVLRAAKKALNNELWKLHKDAEFAVEEYGRADAMDMPYLGFVLPRKARDMLLEALNEFTEQADVPAQ